MAETKTNENEIFIFVLSLQKFEKFQILETDETLIIYTPNLIDSDIWI